MHSHVPIHIVGMVYSKLFLWRDTFHTHSTEINCLTKVWNFLRLQSSILRMMIKYSAVLPLDLINQLIIELMISELALAPFFIRIVYKESIKKTIQFIFSIIRLNGIWSFFDINYAVQEQLVNWQIFLNFIA